MTEEEDRKKFSTFWLSEAEALARLKLEDEKFSKRSFILPLPVFYKRPYYSLFFTLANLGLIFFI